MTDIETIPIKARLVSPGDSNASYKHCFAITYFQGKQLIAYGSGNNVVITTNTFSIVGKLKGHKDGSIVTAVAWATYSGRLSSFATDHNNYNTIIIWEPKRNSGRWEKLQEFDFSLEVNCLSWSKGDNILCAASKKDFQIYIREENKNKNRFSIDQKTDDINFSLNCVYKNNIPTEFCSHSRDSRFILTLPALPDKKDQKENKRRSDSNQDNEDTINGVLIYYKHGKSDNDYSYVLIKHPAPVISARWRTSDQTHGNCCFMTVCADHVVRIWYETGVNEQFKFSVVVSTPSSIKMLAACFISTSSKNISKNALLDSSESSEKETKNEHDQSDPFIYLSEKYKDSYSYGNGHLPKRDSNYREVSVNDSSDIAGSYFYFLTFDKKQNLVIWQVTGLYTKARATPKISQLVIKPAQLGIDSDAINNIYAFCRLTSEYSHSNDKKYIPQPTSLSLILQSKLIGFLTSIDLSINSRNLLVANFISIHGHQTKIRTIRINKNYPFMVTLGEKYKEGDKNRENNLNQPFIWTFNDTDVYDPSIFANFKYQLDIDLAAVDWLYSKSKLIGFTGEKFVIIPLPHSKAPIIEPLRTDIDFKFNNLYDKDSSKVLQFRVLCGSECNKEYSYILSILFGHDFYLLHLHDSKMTELLHLQETKEEFTDMSDSYISQLFHEPGAVLCLISTKHTVYSILLNKDLVSDTPTSDKQAPKIKTPPASAPPKSKPKLPIPELKESSLTPKKNEPASCLQIFTTKETIRSICFIHPAYYIIACDYVIYICRRDHCSSQEVKEFQKIQVDYIPREIRSNPHGMISIVSDNKIELYHQWRPSSEFNHSNLQWRLFASKVKPVTCAEWSLDGFLIYSSNENVYALTKYMDSYFYDESRMYATIHNSLASFSKIIQDFNPAILIPLAISGRYDLLLNMLDYFNQYCENPRISWFYQNYVLNYDIESKKVYDKDVDSLLDSLDNKARMDQISIFNEREKNEFINFISRLKKLLSIQPEVLDQRSIPVARAIALDEFHSIPFDLINLAYISPDQVKLLDFVNFQSWESILNSGVFFWVRDLKILMDKLVPFSINHFDTRKDVSIIILSMTQKFVILKQLFKKCGEEARASFFGRDFSKPKEKKSAEKNGYSALSKHDFYTAAAMFCLSGNINVAIRILMQNTGDLALAYLMCRYTKDDNQSLYKIIDDYLMPKAVEANDCAAIEFFKKQKDQDYQYSLDDRIRSHICGNIISSSNHFYDTRFISCEVLQTTVEQKADLCLSFLLSGASFLNAIYLSYLGNFVLHKESEATRIPESRSIPFDIAAKFSLIDEPSESEADEITEETSENEICVKEVEAFSFGGICGTNYAFASDDFSSDYDDDESGGNYSDDDNISKEDEEINNKKEEENNKEEAPKFPLRENNDTNTNQQQERPLTTTTTTTTTTRRFSIFSRPVKQVPLVNNDNNNNNNSPKPKVHHVLFSGSNSNESFPSFNATVSTSTSNDSIQSGEAENDQKEAFPSFGPRAVRAAVPNFAPASRNPAAAGSNPVRRMSQYLNNTKSTLMNPTSSNLLNKYDENLFEEKKSRQSSLAKLAQAKNQGESFKKVHSDDFDDSDESEEIIGNQSQTVNLSLNLGERKLQSYSNWLLDVIVFNISRLRLEQFTNCQFSNQDKVLTSLIHTKINESNGNIKSMMSHFNDYLIRSCKRRGIISRRLLLISPTDKEKFIRDICHCVVLLPDQLVASRFKKQQIAQISRTTQALIDIINRKLIKDLERPELFIPLTTAILTSMFILALYKHDVKIMHKLLKVNLQIEDMESFAKSIKDFLDYNNEPSIKQFLKVEFIPPGKYPLDAQQKNHWEENYISFISDEMRKSFVNGNITNLPQFASSLIDFLIINTFIKKIKDFKSNSLLKKTKEFYKGNFNLLIMNFKKCYDMVSQLFTYLTINFPSLIEFDSLEKICDNYDSDLNSFTSYLIENDNHEEKILKYSTSIIRTFSLNSNNSLNSNLSSGKNSTKSSMPLSRIGSQNESNISTLNFSEINDNIYANHKVFCLTKIVQNFVLEGPQKIASYNSSIYSICTNASNSIIYYATDKGIKKTAIKSYLSVLKTQNNSLKSSSDSIFLQFDNETNELTAHQEKQHNEEENMNEELNKPEETNNNIQEEEEEDLDQNESTNEETTSDYYNTISEEASSSIETASTSSNQSKSKKSKSSKNSQVVKVKSNTLEETPNSILMSPTENSLLVSYKNGRVDLFYIKDSYSASMRKMLNNLSSESAEDKSESTEKSSKKSPSISEKSDSTGIKKSKKNSESSVAKSGSTDDLQKSKKSKNSSEKKRKSSDKSDSTDDLQKSKKSKDSSEKKRKSSDKSDSTDDIQKAKKSPEKKSKSDSLGKSESIDDIQKAQKSSEKKSKSDSLGKSDSIDDIQKSKKSKESPEKKSKSDSLGKSDSIDDIQKSKKSKESPEKKSKSGSLGKSDSIDDIQKSKKSKESPEKKRKRDTDEDMLKSKKSRESSEKKPKNTDKDEPSELSFEFSESIQQPRTSNSKLQNEFETISRITLCQPNNTPCTAIAFSNDGKLIAAAHKGVVSLWSLNMTDPILIQNPFSIIDTYSSEVTQIVFMQGTGMIITSQVESSRFKGNLCFWDILLPGRSALIASIELKENFGTVLSLAYSPSFSKVFAGTSRGLTCVIDTKMFCIIETIPCFTKKNHDGVQSLAIDAQQMFFVAGSTNGNLAVFDLQNYELIKEKEMIHNKKSLKARGKLRDFAVSSILIDERNIYTCGYDGTIKCLHLNLMSS